MKTKLSLIAVAIGLILVFFLGFRMLSSNSKEEEEISPTPTVVLPTITDEVKVTLKPINQNREVVLSIVNIPSDIKIVEYEMSYETGKGLLKGVNGRIKLKGEREISREIKLGTCSSGKCVYDEGVTSINLSLRFSDANNASSIFQKEYQLE